MNNACNQVVCADCVQYIHNLPDNSMDIIICDPPYNIKKDFGNNKDYLPLDAYVEWCKDWITECMRVLKPYGTMYIYGFSEILAHLSVLLPLNKQRWLQWHYTNKTVPNYQFWQRSHESILCCWKDKPLFNTDAVRVPYSKNFLKNAVGKKRTSTACRFNKNQNYESVYRANPYGAYPKDVIEVAALAGGKGRNERYFYCKTHQCLCAPSTKSMHLNCETIIHPTQKPMELTTKLLLASKPVGTFNVLIPFAGSGSECKVVQQLHGNLFACDLNPDYVLLANAWLNRV